MLRPIVVGSTLSVLLLVASACSSPGTDATNPTVAEPGGLCVLENGNTLACPPSFECQAVGWRIAPDSDHLCIVDVTVGVGEACDIPGVSAGKDGRRRNCGPGLDCPLGTDGGHCEVPHKP